MPRYRDAFCMVHAKPGMKAEHRAESVDKLLAVQRVVRSDPIVRVGDGAQIDCQERTDRTDTEQDGTSTDIRHDTPNAYLCATLRRCGICHHTRLSATAGDRAE